MKLMCTLLLFFSLPSYAGVFELSVQGSNRLTNIDDDNYTKTTSASASIAYYFWQSGAIELTYMLGNTLTNGKLDASTSYEQLLKYKYYGADFIYNIGGSEGSFVPYVKVGIAEIKKELEYKTNGSLVSTQDSSGSNLTYGLGFKIKITQGFSFKASYDVWRGPLNADNPTTDSSVKLGFSWYL